MQFRPYRSQDADALWDVIGPAIKAGETFALPRDMSKTDAVAYWAAPDRDCWLAEIDGEIMGSFYIRPNQMGGGKHIANGGYATKVEARGRGVARAMCMRSIELAAEQGYKAMQFNFVVSSNVAAMTLWQRCGFEIVGRLPGAFDHPRLGYVDAVVMVRQL
jgi:ribosomal protein S18 acetylase RimI-like enzyme